MVYWSCARINQTVGGPKNQNYQIPLSYTTAEINHQKVVYTTFSREMVNSALGARAARRGGVERGQRRGEGRRRAYTGRRGDDRIRRHPAPAHVGGIEVRLCDGHS